MKKCTCDIQKLLLEYIERTLALVRAQHKKLAVGCMLLGSIGVLVTSNVLLRPRRYTVTQTYTSVGMYKKLEPLSLPAAEPRRLKIDRIGVDAPFVALGLKADGTMETPNDGVHVGWYKYAPTPGEIGPAVIAGHVTMSGPAVFARLNVLVSGDIVTIERADGSAARFVVDDVKQFSQNDFPTDAVYGSIDYAGIRLITCGGVYDRATKRYTHNTVVFGSLIAE